MVIDLGDVRSVAETPDRQRRRPARPAAQPVVLGAVMLALLALGGSAGPLPALHRVLTADGSSGVFAPPSTLFTAGSDASTGDRTWVRRYSLPDRSMTWAARLPQSVERLDFAGSANVLVAASLSTIDDGQISVLDGDTGRVLWRRASGVAVLRLADTSALISTAATDPPVLNRVDLRTGATLWSRSFDPTEYLDVGDPAFGAPTRIVTVDRRGLATVYDFTDGTVLAAADLGAGPRQNDGRTDTTQFTAVGDRLYLARRVRGAASLTAYRLADLQRVWRSTSVPVGRLTWCGSALCVTTAVGMTVLDSADGSVRWSGTRWLLGYDTRAAGIPGPARLAVIDGLENPQRALLDPASGRVLSLLSRSTFVGGTLLRSDVREAGRTWVQVPGPGNSFRTVGRLETVAPTRCVAVTAYLACPTSTGSTAVWQIPH